MPQAGGYQVRVGYRPAAGSGSWTVFGVSSGCFTVAAPALAITVPAVSGSYAQNASLPVTWTTSQAVASGEFAVWAVSPSGWYVGKLVAANGTASYATSITLAVPRQRLPGPRRLPAHVPAAAPGRSTASAAAHSR